MHELTSKEIEIRTMAIEELNAEIEKLREENKGLKKDLTYFQELAAFYEM